MEQRLEPIDQPKQGLVRRELGLRHHHRRQQPFPHQLEPFHRPKRMGLLQLVLPLRRVRKAPECLYHLQQERPQHRC